MPRTSAQLTKILAEYPSAVVLAGGTDLALEVTQQLHSLQHIVCLSRVEEIRHIQFEDDLCRIGACLIV